VLIGYTIRDNVIASTFREGAPGGLILGSLCICDVNWPREFWHQYQPRPRVLAEARPRPKLEALLNWPQKMRYSMENNIGCIHFVVVSSELQFRCLPRPIYTNG